MAGSPLTLTNEQVAVLEKLDRGEILSNDEAEVLSTIPTPELAGPGEAFMRGVTSLGPGRLAELGVDAFERVAEKPLAVMSALAPEGSDFKKAADETIAFDRGGDLRGRFVKWMDSKTGLRPSRTNKRGRAFEEAGAGLVSAVPMAAATVMSGGADAIPMAAGMLGLEAAGGFVGEELGMKADKAGLPPIIGALTRMGGSMAVTGAVPAVIGSTVNKYGPDIADAASNQARALGASDEVRDLARRSGSPMSSVYKASSRFKTWFPEGPPDNPNMFTDEIADAAEEALRRFGPDEQPTFEQILQGLYEDQGNVLSSYTQQMSNRPVISSKIQGKRWLAERRLSDELRALLPDGDPDSVSQAGMFIRLKRYKGVRNAWKEVPKRDMPMVPVRGMRQTAQHVIREAGDLTDEIPNEAYIIAEWPNEVPWQEYQRVRSRLLRSERIAKRRTAETATQLQSFGRSRIIKSSNRALDNLIASSGAKGQKLQRALQSTREYYRDFDMGGIVAKSLNTEKTGELAKALIRSKNPITDAETVMRIYSQDPAAQRALQRSWWDEVIGMVELSPKGSKKALARLQANEKQARIVLGEEPVARLQAILEKGEVLGMTRTARYSLAQGTQSGALAAPADALVAGGEVITNPSMVMGRHAIAAPVKAIANALKKRDSMFVSRVLFNGAMNGQDGVTLLRLPTPREQEAWMLNWQELVKRSTPAVVVQGLTTDGRE